MSGRGAVAQRPRYRPRLYKVFLATAATVSGAGLAAYAAGPEPITKDRLVEIVRAQEARIQDLERRIEAREARAEAQPVGEAGLERMRGGAFPGRRLPRLDGDGGSHVVPAQLATGQERLRERPEPVAPKPWPSVASASDALPSTTASADVNRRPRPSAGEVPELPPEAVGEADASGEGVEVGAVGEIGAPGEYDAADDARREDALLLEQGAILLPQGTLQLEGSLDYTRFSGPRVAISGMTLFEAIVIGLIRVEELERDIFTAAKTGRYGITDRLQAEVRVPYVYRHDRELRDVGTEEPSERETEMDDIGDVSARLSYQPIIGRGLKPDIILRAEGLFPTGTDPFGIPREEVDQGVFRLAHPPTGNGFYELGGGGLASWRVDPVVFYAGGTYTHRFERSFGGQFGNVQPGAGVQFFGGVNARLTDRFGFNFSFIDQVNFSSEQDGEEQPGTQSNDARFLVGTSLSLNPATSLLASTGVGLTNDAPDFQFTMSLSHTFHLGP